MPAAVILLVVLYVCYVVDKDLLKNNRWVFDNARKFVFAVWFAEKAHKEPFTTWSYDPTEGFIGVKKSALLTLKSYALEVAKMQDVPFEARKAAKMKKGWLLHKKLLRQLFPELPESDGAYFRTL